MTLWTTFSPQKVVWEITTIQHKGKAGTSDWMMHKDIINESLALLKKSGIDGIRLVIFPTEITKDGKSFNWIPIDNMLALCRKNKLLVDLCIGPFQYPHYPGIYLPEKVLHNLSSQAPLLSSRAKSRDLLTKLQVNFRSQKIPQPLLKRSLHALRLVGMTEYIDENQSIHKYGITFLQKHLDRYASDDRIRGFHFANEWPDAQRIAGREDIKASISKAFMLEATRMIKKATQKPVSLNTNIDASDKGKLFDTFKDIFVMLDKQGKLGFDIYPSQETWKKAPLQKLRRLVEEYTTSFTNVCKMFTPCEMYFAEVEAQPWGDGRSWYRIIKAEEHPKDQVLGYTKHSLQTTWQTHIANTPCQTISLWGSDFWLSAHQMGIRWPLEVVTKLRLEN